MYSKKEEVKDLAIGGAFGMFMIPMFLGFHYNGEVYGGWFWKICVFFAEMYGTMPS